MLEAIVVRVSFPHAKSVLIAVAYRPPNAPVAWYGVLDDFIEPLCARECQLVLMGDINIVILDGLHTAPYAWQDIIDGHQLTLIVINIGSVLCVSVPVLIVEEGSRLIPSALEPPQLPRGIRWQAHRDQAADTFGRGVLQLQALF